MGNSGQSEQFQERVVRAVRAVLSRNGIDAEFVSDGDARYAEFCWRGAAYVIAAFTSEINMREGPNLYECYLREEFASEEDYIVSFCSRLDQFLRNGEWKIPRERSS